jgi:hypothetical protein
MAAAAARPPGRLQLRLEAHVGRDAQPAVLAEARAVERELVAAGQRRGLVAVPGGTALAGVPVVAAAPVRAAAYVPGVAGVATGLGALWTLHDGRIDLWATSADGARLQLAAAPGVLPTAVPYAGACAIAVSDGGAGLLVATDAGVVHGRPTGSSQGPWALSRPLPLSERATSVRACVLSRPLPDGDEERWWADACVQVVAMDALAPGAWAAAVGAAVVVVAGGAETPGSLVPLPAPITALHVRRGAGTELLMGDVHGRMMVLDVRHGARAISFGDGALQAIRALDTDGPLVVGAPSAQLRCAYAAS